MTITEFSVEFEKRLAAAQDALDGSPSGYRYGWVNPKAILARMELDGLKIDAAEPPEPPPLWQRLREWLR